jgi:hypothetical protein
LAYLVAKPRQRLMRKKAFSTKCPTAISLIEAILFGRNDNAYPIIPCIFNGFTRIISPIRQQMVGRKAIFMRLIA